MDSNFNSEIITTYPCVLTQEGGGGGGGGGSVGISGEFIWSDLLAALVEHSGRDSAYFVAIANTVSPA